MSSLFVNFARTGVPTHLACPSGTLCARRPAHHALDRECKLVHNFDDKLYEAYLPVAVNPKDLHEEEVTMLH